MAEISKAKLETAVWFAQHRPSFLRVLTRRLGNPADAEEVLQDAYLAFDRAQSEKPIENPAGYLMRIALNLAVDRMRQDNSRRMREKSWTDQRFGYRPGSSIGVTEISPERELAGKNELKNLARYLEELSPQVRKAFILHKINGLSHAETANQMSLSVSTVEKHIMKAMKHVLAKMPDRGIW